MHSNLSRCNAVFSVTFVALAFSACTFSFLSYLRHEYVRPSTVTGKITIVESYIEDVVLAHPMQHTSTQNVERAVLMMDLAADFTDCFDWNTKQVFVYVMAEYETKEHSLNQVMLYDQIITSKEKAVLDLKRVADYPLQHINNKGLAGNDNVTLKLKFHIMCHSGVTHTQEVPSAQLTIKIPPKNQYQQQQQQQRMQQQYRRNNVGAGF